MMSAALRACDCHSPGRVLGLAARMGSTVARAQLERALADAATGALRDKTLFTPRPLGVSFTTKLAMLHDYGSRDPTFLTVVREIRSGLLSVAGVPPDEWVAVPMQARRRDAAALCRQHRRASWRPASIRMRR